ncbi:MAG: hypothetical protein NT122_06160 [Solirubrobacterales bacterium]|nr:hypothetical protein [Solirubrobacterales bacterium]
MTSIKPLAAGLTAEVLNYDSHLSLVNRTRQVVVVSGYDKGDQVARLLPDGTVQVNLMSPSYWLNQDRLGRAAVPAAADRSAAPNWKTLDRTGRYTWHDHRIHWMGASRPPQVKTQATRTKLFGWQVPLTVGDRRTEIFGNLVWVGSKSNLPLAAVVAIVLLAVALTAAAFAVRWRSRAANEQSQ